MPSPETVRAAIRILDVATNYIDSTVMRVGMDLGFAWDSNAVALACDAQTSASREVLGDFRVVRAEAACLLRESWLPGMKVYRK